MPPWILLAAFLASVYGVVFHLVRGGGVRRLALFVAASWAGFGLGQLAGTLAGWNAVLIGDVHVVEATLGSLIALLVVNRPAA